MSMLDSHEPEDRKPEEIDASKGYEASDVRISGVVGFLVAMSIFAVVTGVLAYGIGKFLNAHMAKEDGPKNKWATTVDVRPLGNMPSSPELQKKMTGDRKPAVAVPLTNGFARTGYEQDEARSEEH